MVVERRLIDGMAFGLALFSSYNDPVPDDGELHAAKLIDLADGKGRAPWWW